MGYKIQMSNVSTCANVSMSTFRNASSCSCSGCCSSCCCCHCCCIL